MQFTKYFNLLTSNSTNININTYNTQYLPTGSYEPDTVLCILYADLCYSLWQRQIHNFCIWKNSVAQSVWKGRIGVGYKGVFA